VAGKTSLEDHRARHRAARSAADPNYASESSVAERVTGSLQSAVAQIPRISTGFSGFSTSLAGASYSIDGQSAADTGLSLNGIPLGAVGGSNLGTNPDLFAGAGIGEGAQSGALGGNVNFQSLEPTIAWQTRLESSVGSFDQSSAIVREQGSAGDLGVAFVAATRTTSDALNHQQYADGSGVQTMHDTYDTSQGFYGKLRAQAGLSHTLAATYIGNGYDMPVECTVLQGTLPCGYGVGNILQGDVAERSGFRFQAFAPRRPSRAVECRDSTSCSHRKSEQRTGHARTVRLFRQMIETHRPRLGVRT